MKKSVIIYGSQYGSTQKYAEHLSEVTGIECISCSEVENINDYERIIYMGALYAGGVLGLKKLAKKLTTQELIVVTVGIADPTKLENIQNIRESLKTQIPERFFNEKNIFHLRGAIDYGHLNIKHKIMMSMVHSKVSKMPEEELNEESKAMLATYGKQVDFIDYDSLKNLITILNSNTPR